MDCLLKPRHLVYLLVSLSGTALVSFALGVSLAYFGTCINKTYSVSAISIWKDVITVILGILALILGFVYFISRIRYEDKIARNQRIRNRMSLILDELKKYDQYISQIIHLTNVSDDIKLNFIRNKIERSFELIELYLEKNDPLLGFSSKELNKIISVNSYVNNNNEIMNLPYEKLKEADLSDIQLQYIDFLQEARSTCIGKME